jgi:hypothetical protein
MPVDDQLVQRERGLVADRGMREQPVQVHRDRAIGRETQGGITVAPVFNEGYVWVGLSGGGGHRVKIAYKSSASVRNKGLAGNVCS